MLWQDSQGIGSGQTKLTQAKTVLAQAMQKREAGNHEAAMAEMAEAMTMITQPRPSSPMWRDLAVAPCCVRVESFLTRCRA
jgi:hypothetical protein